MRAELCGGRVVLSGKADLTLGQPEGTGAGKVIIDLKTGGFAPVHREDLRFYALLEACGRFRPDAWPPTTSTKDAPILRT